jgi:hypothetical protein
LAGKKEIRGFSKQIPLKRNQSNNNNDDDDIQTRKRTVVVIPFRFSFTDATAVGRGFLSQTLSFFGLDSFDVSPTALVRVGQKGVDGQEDGNSRMYRP